LRSARNQESAFVSHTPRKADPRQRFVIQANGLEVRVIVWNSSTAMWSGGGHMGMEAGGT
jgi:hypothetical protein